MRYPTRLTVRWIALSAALLPFGCGGSVTTPGSGGAGGHASSASSETTSTSASSSASGDNCGECQGFSCCGSTCVNLKNDIKNCGSCGNTCLGADPYCDQGVCAKPPCDATASCPGKLCCGTLCCDVGQLCCRVPGSVGEIFQCSPSTPEGTCPKGCVLCVCASPETPIATPYGDRAIADLAPGDVVYSVHRESILAVPILRVNKVAVRDHHVMRVRFEDGAVLNISPRHPTADGRSFADLGPGDRLNGREIKDARLIPYSHPFTYDILPDSDTGAYFAAGTLIGSTLFDP